MQTEYEIKAGAGKAAGAAAETEKSIEAAAPVLSPSPGNRRRRMNRTLLTAADILLFTASLFCAVECVGNTLRGTDGIVLYGVGENAGESVSFTGYYLVAAGWGTFAFIIAVAAIWLAAALRARSRRRA